MNGNVDFNAVFAAWDGGALAAYQALKQAGRTGLIVAGHDAYEAACDLMIANDPIFKAPAAQNPVNMGKLVMHEGQISGELTRQEATQEKILRLAAGGI
jgi:ABC-type sugar transport system substrate-binding protein